MTAALLLVGTRKGAFIYRSDERRTAWTLSEPMLKGWQVYHLAVDARRDPPRLLATTNSAWFGSTIARSDDLGKTWTQRAPGMGFPKDMGETVKFIWRIQPGHRAQPGVVFAGTDPAGLFRSEDWGESWRPVDGIVRHEWRSFWQPMPGAAFSIMNVLVGQGGEERAREIARNSGLPAGGNVDSIEIDPRDPARMYVAIGGGGGYRSEDGGQTWTLFSHRARPTSPGVLLFVSQSAAGAPPDVDPQAEFDMHSLRLDAKNPDRLWAQAHMGVYRSDDRGETWADVSAGLPSFHGFPVAVTKREPDAAYVVPLEANDFRVCPGQFAVYRTSDAGKTWQALTRGLPGDGDYQSVYRAALDTDGLAPEGVYVGTSNGQVYASSDGGDHWSRLPGTLPPVLSVTPAVVG
jgi:photosystem II stability/assembly factor-like uncharacterized protein